VAGVPQPWACAHKNTAWAQRCPGASNQSNMIYSHAGRVFLPGSPPLARAPPRLYRDQGKSLTISHDALLVTLVEAAPLVAGKAAAAAAASSGGGGCGDGGSTTTQQQPGCDGASAGPNPDGECGWMRRWDDGVTMADVPLEGLLLAAGELTLRVDEEDARRERARAAGVLHEARMAGSEDGNAAVDAGGCAWDRLPGRLGLVAPSLHDACHGSKRQGAREEGHSE
jgi:hypothetical protein